MKLTLKLVKSARKSGGDRYEGTVPTIGEVIVIYFPQSISRKAGAPAPQLTIEVTEG